jgi:hypothetical protein
VPKIGGPSHEGENRGASSGLGKKGSHGLASEPEKAAATLPQDWLPGHCYSHLWGLKAYLDANFPNTAVGYSGVFNIEDNTVEVKGEIFAGCDHYDDLVADCHSCGRQKGNNLGVLSGRGDGVYAGINYWESGVWADGDLKGPDLLASVYLFDENNAHAVESFKTTRSEAERFFFGFASEYRDLPGSIVGDVTAGKHGLWIGGKSAHNKSDDALVHHWGSENKTYRVVAFSEPVEASKMFVRPSENEQPRDSDGERELPLRPRVLVVIRVDIAAALFQGESGLLDIDWSLQPGLGKNMLVESNIGGNLSVACLNNDGLYWRYVYDEDIKRRGKLAPGARKYQLRAFGLFLQGAILGDQNCRSRVTEMLNDSEAEPLDKDAVARVMTDRGWAVDDSVVELVDSLRPTGGI